LEHLEEHSVRTREHLCITGTGTLAQNVDSMQRSNDSISDDTSTPSQLKLRQVSQQAMDDGMSGRQPRSCKRTSGHRARTAGALAQEDEQPHRAHEWPQHAYGRRARARGRAAPLCAQPRSCKRTSGHRAFSRRTRARGRAAPPCAPVHN
jgi:hypothetical protein